MGCLRVSNIVGEVRIIQQTYGVTHVVMEDYQLISGKTNGVFVIPALIGVLKYDWYTRNTTEPIMVKSATWKYLVCGNGTAGKDQVVDCMLTTDLLSKSEYNQIKKEFASNKRVSDQDPQDCFDAMAIDSFVILSIERNIKREALKINGTD